MPLTEHRTESIGRDKFNHVEARDIIPGTQNNYHGLSSKELALWSLGIGTGLGLGAYALYKLHQWWHQPEKPLAENPSAQHRFAESLKASYEKSRIIRLFTKPEDGENFLNLYTKLSLVREDEVREDRKSLKEQLTQSIDQPEDVALVDSQSRMEHIHLFEHMVYSQREPIDEAELFNLSDKDSKDVKAKNKIDRILIQGQAGIGKSTFCYHYALLLMQDVDKLAFTIPLRKLRDQTELLDDAKVLKAIIPDIVNDYSDDELKAFLKVKAGSLYWILDGYDEIANLANNHPLKVWLYEHAFRKDRVILTTRPQQVQEFVQDRYIEMTGFSNNDIYGQDTTEGRKPGYIERYFKNKIKQEAFRTFLKSQTQLMGMVRIPVVLELMCFAWEDSLSHEKTPITSLNLTDLYTLIYESLCKRYLMKSSGDLIVEDLSKAEILEEINNKGIEIALNEIAYHSFNNNRFVFTGSDILSYFLEGMPASRRKTVLHEFGLIRCIEDKGIFEKTEYSFQHLTLQEYITAKAWVSRFIGTDPAKAKAIQLFKDNKYNKRYELIWGFVAGLLSKIPSSGADTHSYLKLFLDLLDAAPREILGARHLTLLIQVLGEANYLPMDSREYNLIKRWLDKENPNRMIGLDVYTAMLSRYPSLIHGPLRNIFEKIYQDSGNDYFSIELFNHDIKLDDGKLFINYILMKLKDHDVVVKRTIAHYMRFINWPEGEMPFQVIQALLETMKDTDSDVRKSSTRALEKIQKLLDSEITSQIIQALLDALMDTEWYVRKTASSVLRYIKLPDEEKLQITSILLDALNDNEIDSAWRCSIIDALGEIKISEYEVILQVIQAFFDAMKDLNLEESAHFALCNLIKELDYEMTLQIIPTLLNALKKSKSIVRSSATEALGNIKGEVTLQIIQALLIALNDKKSIVRISAAKTLGSIKLPEGEVTFQITLALLDSLKDANWKVRTSAAKTLGNIKLPEGEVALQVSLALLDSLKDSNRNARISAAEALGNIKLPDDEVALQITLSLLDSLKDTNWNVRISAAMTLSKLKLLKDEVTLQVIQTLLEALKDLDDRTRTSAAVALENIKLPEDEVTLQVIRAFLEALKDSDYMMKTSAADALGVIKLPEGEMTLQVIRALLDEIKHEYWVVNFSALRALNKINKNQIIIANDYHYTSLPINTLSRIMINNSPETASAEMSRNFS